MIVRFLLVAVSILGLAGCQTIAGSNLSPDKISILQSELAKRSSKFVQSTDSKAMSGCFDWDREIRGAPWPQFRVSFYVSQSSDGDIPVSELMPAAVYECEKYKKERNRTCDCVPFVINDTIVLQVP